VGFAKFIYLDLPLLWNVFYWMGRTVRY